MNARLASAGSPAGRSGLRSRSPDITGGELPGSVIKAKGVTVMYARISTLLFAVFATACGGSSSPTAASPTAISPTGVSPVASSTTTASSSITKWSGAQRFVSVSGPDNCWVREQRQWLTGSRWPDSPITITRSAGSISVESEDWAVKYVGSTAGSEFSAPGSEPLEGGGRPCQDGTSFRQMPGVSVLSGRFSADDQLMTATEVNSYPLTSGEIVTYTWEWQAKRE